MKRRFLISAVNDAWPTNETSALLAMCTILQDRFRGSRLRAKARPGSCSPSTTMFISDLTVGAHDNRIIALASL
jgi:hypothetical protein